VWKSNANNGVTRYYLYDRNGNATLQLDTTGTGITAKSADQLKDLTGVSYTETVYDKRNQVIEVREPKFNQDKLDTSLNLFNQTISRTVDKSTVSLTDSASKLSFNVDSQKLSIQTNASRVIFNYWPKGSTATASNTLTVDMQATTTAGLFVLDIGAIKANIDYSYNYIYKYNTDFYGERLTDGTGTIRRSVNIAEPFSGSEVIAKPLIDINDIDYSVKGKPDVINNKYLLIKDVPVETSRVEVKYRINPASENWGTLIYSAEFNNNYNGYMVNLSTLSAPDEGMMYDFVYILYDSKGHILGGNSLEYVLYSPDYSRDLKWDFNGNILNAFDERFKSAIFSDKDKDINQKIDVNQSLSSSGGEVAATLVSNSPFKIKYTFTRAQLTSYKADKSDYQISFFFKGKNGVYEKKNPTRYTLDNFNGPLSLDIELEFTKDEFERFYNVTESINKITKGYLDIKIGFDQDNRYLEIGSGLQNLTVSNVYAGSPVYTLDTSSKISLLSQSFIRLTNQPLNTTSVEMFVRKYESSYLDYKLVRFIYNFSDWDRYEARQVYDVYGEKVEGVFEVSPFLYKDTHYQFEYVSYNNMEVINRQLGDFRTTKNEESYGGIDISSIYTIPLNYGGNGFVMSEGHARLRGLSFFIPTIWDINPPDYGFPFAYVKIKYRQVGTKDWITSYASVDEKTGYFYWKTDDLTAGEYEFQVRSHKFFDDAWDDIVEDAKLNLRLIGKVSIGTELGSIKVLEQWSSSLFQNQITFARQPIGSSQVTVKYGTAAGLLNKTAVLPVDSEGKAILDVLELAEQNLLGSTTVYYSYETTDANGKLLNRATGYVNVGMGAGSGQHTNQLNDSWLDFQPAQNNGSKMELFYRKRQVDASGNFVSDLVSADINSDAYWASSNQFQKVSLTPSNGIYRWNLNDLVPKSGFENYEYFYQLYDSTGKVIAFVPGKLSIDSKGNGSSQQNKWVINGSGDRASQIVKSQAYNAFGEIISETDGNGNTSSLSYNTMGKLTKKVLPTVDIRKSDGTVVQGTPTLEYGYDLSGRLLTSKDANGNINKQSYLNGRNLETGDWLVEKETHADTGEVSNLYDVYGNLIEQSNALGVKTGYSYDINGNLIQITRAARTTGTVGATHITSGGVQTSLIDTFTYDELGNRLSATNALKNTTTTDYDALGRVVQSKTAEGVTTKVDYVYDASISNLNSSKGGIKRTETDGLGKTVVDEQDYFGRTIKHTDKGAHVFTYTYNAGGWLTKQINSQGQSLEYSYYSNGAIKEIRDIALNLLTSYRYDDNGNRIEERYQDLNAKTGELRVFQNALINYDSLNRKISVQDQSFNIHYEYDGNGNIVHMLANYRDAVNAAPKIQDFWYSYDSMNRFTISMGVLNSTAKKIERGNTGIAISYDKLGQRLTADYGKDALNSTKAHKESYSYTTDGYLETVKNADYSSTGILGTQYTVSTRYNDALGRVTQYTDNNENSATVYQTTTTTYSKDNQITEQKKEGGNGAGTTKYTYLADKATLDKTVMTPTSGSIQTTQYAYEWWDSAKQSKITTTVDGLKGETSLSYNINGHLTDFVDDRNTNNRRVATYINNSQGMVLQRNELINDSINRYRNFYYVNGQRVGDLSNDGPSREDYVQNLQSNRATATQAKDFKPISSADFDQNFEPINAQYPSSASTSYVVNNGDTLQSIALSVWGDASMWYMLADVNGLSATDKLTAGQVLTVPNKVTNIHNNSETFRPYNPGETIGNTQPTVPSPPPPPKPKKKCGGIAQIIMIVVAVVVTVVVSYFGGPQAGAAVAKGFTALGASASTAAAAGTVATAATAAAAGSVASQLAGKAMGVVDSFSWTQVGISALSAGITAGVVGALAPTAGTAGTTGATATQGSWVTTAKEAIEKGGWVAKGIVSGVTSYGSNYIANQVFGNNQSFSWASLGSSIVSSIVAAGMGEKGVFDVLGKAASPYAYSLAGANAAAVIDDKWFGGTKPDYLNVSMAAIANTIGRQFGESSNSSQYKSNITVYNPATGERTALDETQALYAFDIEGIIDKVKRRVEAGIDYMNERIDDARELFYDYMPNNSRENSIALVNGANSDVTQLPPIKVQATKNPNIVYALGGVNSTYNMTAALGRVEERARLQREIDISNANNRRTWQEWADDANYSGSFTDAAKYVSRQAYLKVAKFTTFGLIDRSDERLLQVRQGKLPSSLARRADLIEAGTGAAVTLAGAGIFNILRATGSAGLARMGLGEATQYYGGSAIAGSGTGALMDTGLQSAERINYDISGGITGRSEYDLGQITLSSVVGGVASPLLDVIPAFASSKYNVDLQWPIYFDVSAGQLNSGLSLSLRGPILPKRIFDPDGNPLPFGFKGYDEYLEFTNLLKASLPENTTAIFKGSSVTGRSSPFSKIPNSPFDYNRLSDFDIALVNDDLYLNALELGRNNGFKVKSLPDRMGPLSNEQLARLGLKDLRIDLTKKAGRPVDFMLYDSIEGALLRGNSHIVK
jgi:YD repeat-containing protein